MSGLQVRDAVVRYGEVKAVDGVSLDVAPGEIVVLLGGSGSGKSSLLRAIAGLEPLVRGSVRWDGEDLAGVPVHRRGIGLMFQDGQLFPHLTVAGNVGYGLFGLRSRQRRERVVELLALVGLDGLGDRPITALSGGQAQRVALARSLAPKPRLLLLDEPLAALDRALRERLVDTLGEVLRATGTTAVYVTHDQDEAFAIGDRIAVLDSGRLRQVGTPEDVWGSPADQTVAAFLGYGPFLPVDAALRLGWAGAIPAGLVEPVETPASVVVGIGPLGLVADADGTPVPILDQRHHRGFVEVQVRLPDGQEAVLRSGGWLEGSAVAVRLDASGCAVVPRQ